MPLPVVAEHVIRRRDALLQSQAQLMEKRHTIMLELRRIDRELADCRATARFFGLDVEFPTNAPEYVEQIEKERAERERAMRIASPRERERAEAAAEATKHNAEARRRILELARAQPSGQRDKPTAPVEEAPKAPISETPKSAATFVLDARPAHFHLGGGPATQTHSIRTLRDVVIDRLKSAGEDGVKAAQIRDFYERTYGRVIHEKTVGMTLYRLQAERIVRREGHIWFFVPPEARAENPGGDTPGPINSGT